MPRRLLQRLLKPLRRKLPRLRKQRLLLKSNNLL
jgi:hypothetical protein